MRSSRARSSSVIWCLHRYSQTGSAARSARKQPLPSGCPSARKDLSHQSQDLKRKQRRFMFRRCLARQVPCAVRLDQRQIGLLRALFKWVPFPAWKAFPDPAGTPDNRCAALWRNFLSTASRLWSCPILRRTVNVRRSCHQYLLIVFTQKPAISYSSVVFRQPPMIETTWFFSFKMGTPFPFLPAPASVFLFSARFKHLLCPFCRLSFSLYHTHFGLSNFTRAVKA